FLLNGRNIETLEGDETELRDGDLVILLPPFAGG
ncbi:MoaD/ThiS family protein, partial [Candidatus Bathyarchaeota archaeon]|nr:MoaD/ThiS family protein [Candidatus Bathyarchaeota archaeon]